MLDVELQPEELLLEACNSGIKLVAEKYSVGAVESQVWVQGPSDTEVWLGVKLARSKVSVIGWMFSGELQRPAGEGSRW